VDFNKLSQIGLRARWNKAHHPVREHISLSHSGLKLEKARLLGFLMGDGCVTSKKSNTVSRHHDIRFYPDDLLLAKIFVRDFESLYLKTPIIKKMKNYFIVHASSKPAWEDLMAITNFGSLEWSFPDNVLISKAEKAEWLKAMFDCEGSVGKNRIQLQSVSGKGIESISLLLAEFGIKSSVCIYKRPNPKWNDNYVLSVCKANLLNFLNEVGFNHPAKQEKLKHLADVPER
tara:strand:+ start:525 stop:1217 length:693 start_codon:yes stop_codon:yes gene_type:complete